MSGEGMTKLFRLLPIPLVVWAMWVAVSEPMVGRPAFSGQPALVSDQAASRLAPTGFDQAQEDAR